MKPHADSLSGLFATLKELKHLNQGDICALFHMSRSRLRDHSMGAPRPDIFTFVDYINCFSRQGVAISRRNGANLFAHWCRQEELLWTDSSVIVEKFLGKTLSQVEEQAKNYLQKPMADKTALQMLGDLLHARRIILTGLSREKFAAALPQAAERALIKSGHCPHQLPFRMKNTEDGDTLLSLAYLDAVLSVYDVCVEACESTNILPGYKVDKNLVYALRLRAVAEKIGLPLSQSTAKTLGTVPLITVLRCYAGLSEKETAHIMGMAPARYYLIERLAAGNVAPGELRKFVGHMRQYTDADPLGVVREGLATLQGRTLSGFRSP